MYPMARMLAVLADRYTSPFICKQFVHNHSIFSTALLVLPCLAVCVALSALLKALKNAWVCRVMDVWSNHQVASPLPLILVLVVRPLEASLVDNLMASLVVKALVASLVVKAVVASLADSQAQEAKAMEASLLTRALVDNLVVRLQGPSTTLDRH